ncbi:MAG: hypothetical protein ABEL97_06590 [Salinibacter sp.]
MSSRSTSVLTTLLVVGLLGLTGCDSSGSLRPDQTGAAGTDGEVTTNDRAGPPDAASGQASTVYRASLNSLNGSDVEGVAKIRVQGGRLTVQVNARGHVPGKVHPQHIHARKSGSESTCPSASADSDGDGLVSVGEGIPAYGSVFVPLDGSLGTAEGLGEIATFPTPGNQGGAITYRQTIGLESVGTNFDAPLDLEKRAIVLHGENVKGTYVPTLPVACGTIEQVN